MINEEIFKYENLTNDEQDYLYNLFRSSYIKTTGKSWSKEKFIEKSKNLLFFGDKINGFLAVKEKNGIYKLSISAGNLTSIIGGIIELNSLNRPVWGLTNDKLKNFLVNKFNFIPLNKEMINKLPKNFISSKDFINNEDDSITFSYEDVGVSKKFIVVNQLFYKLYLSKLNLSDLVNEENIVPPNIPNTMNFWHGGNLDNYVESIAHKKGRYEYGPGLYGITKYDVAQKYSKGGRKLYLLSIEKGNEINDVFIDINKVNEFINNFVISKKKKILLDRYNDFINENKINASIFLNSILNLDAIKPTYISELRNFLIDNNVDYELVHNPFGWGETMIVLYNMKKIKNKIIINPKDKIEIFDLENED